MPKPSPTRTHLLIEARLGRPLEDYVKEQRSEGVSWHLIAVRLNEATGVPVTSETLRVWFHYLPAPAKAGAA